MLFCSRKISYNLISFFFLRVIWFWRPLEKKKRRNWSICFCLHLTKCFGSQLNSNVFYFQEGRLLKKIEKKKLTLSEAMVTLFLTCRKSLFFTNCIIDWKSKKMICMFTLPRKKKKKIKCGWLYLRVREQKQAEKMGFWSQWK